MQRAIAEHRGLASDRPLASPVHELGSQDTPKTEQSGSQASQSKESLLSTGEQKRKYRRHPKPDEHAPEKPPSAYVLFSNKIREEVKGDNLSFTEIARLVGERWQKLSASQKELFESHAAALKDRYNAQLAEYKKTAAYQQYMEYLADFKAKHGATPRDHSSDFKRPKLEPNHSSSLSAASQADSVEGVPDVPGHVRGGSIGSASTASQFAGLPSSASASALQLVTALPLLDDHERATSPPARRKRHPTGRFSTQSSVSEDNDPRSDSTDALQKAAYLTLSTPSSRESPLSSSMTHRPSQEQTSPAPPQPWPLPQSQSVSYHQPTSASGMNWHPGLEQSLYPDQSAVDTPAAAHTGSMPISQLLGPSFGTTSNITPQRTLPRPWHPNEPQPTIIFGGSSRQGLQHEAGKFVPASTQSPSLQRYQDRDDNTATSESEAADTLAGLARGNQRYDPARTPRNRSHGRR